MDRNEDVGAFLAAALGEVCFGKEETHPLEATIDRYFSPDYQQRTDGETTDRAGFAAHIRTLRSLVAEGRIEVLEALRVGERIGDRHRVTLTRTDGTTSEIEVYLFGTLDADGRLLRVDEVSRVVVGGEADAALARAR
jgi:hypothetical protein